MIPIILFYGNKNVSMVFVWWVLCALLLLKIIVSMKKCYVYVWAMGWNVWGLCVCFLKIVKTWKVCVWKTVLGLSKTHYSSGRLLLCFFNKVAGVRTATLLKKRLWHRCFPVTFAKFLITSFFIEQPLVAASEWGSKFLFT